MHTVAVLAYPGMSGFESGIAAEIFGMTEYTGPFSAGIERPWYSVKYCSPSPGGVSMIGGATLTTPYGLDDLADADTVVIPSVADVTTHTEHDVTEAIRTASGRGSRLVSICSGAFALAEAGVLDGLSATTHWVYVDLFQQRFPDIDVDPTPLYVDAGSVLTSAGCAAGLDLCLHIIRSDRGAAVANDVARRLVAPPHRAGGQAQYIDAPVSVATDDSRISQSMAWALDHLGSPIGLDQLASQAAVSRRSYLRQFAQATGTTPIKWLIGQRVTASLELLESTTLSVEQVARRVGFESAVTYRHHFVRAMRTTPSDYRTAFVHDSA